MPTLVTLLFQGDVESSGPLSAAEEREVVHAAFPASPPRDATARDDYRAWKIVPLSSGRTLLSTAVNGDDKDGYGRPVLRAHGCLLAAGEAGAWRDPAAVWEALEAHDPAAGAEAFAGRVEASSIHTAPEAFARFRAELDRAGAFHARVAGALGRESADLYLGDPGRAADLLRPAFGLLPLDRLRRLHLAIGGDASGNREPLLGLAGRAPGEWREGGLLSRLFGRKKDGRSEAAVDFTTGKVFGVRGDGPAALAAAIADPEPWPAGLDARDRYRVLLECLDAGRTPFDVIPELEALRRAVERIERLSKDLARSR